MNEGPAFDPEQQAAIDACCDVSKRIVGVSGEAGTGKTLIIKEVHRRLTAAGYEVVCSAPTGKAAKRISESTGLRAMTNHRLLGYGMPIDHEEVDEITGKVEKMKLSTGPSYDRRRPLPYDVVLCDEAAMVNQEIYRGIIGALKPGGRICMFGDTNQLKPIEPNEDRKNPAPSPFQFVLDKFTGIVLVTNYRQQEGSGIIANARRVLLGRMPSRTEDFNIIYTDEPTVRLSAFIKEQLLEGKDYSTLNYQVITCMNKSWIGTKKLNLTLQNLFWDRDAPKLDLPRHKWEAEDAIVRVQVGSKVVYTANTYDMGNESSVFNGEAGIVVDINNEDGSFDIDFGDRVVNIPPLIVIVKGDNVTEQDPRKNVELAYCLTTHKMQGSEVKSVTYIINKSTMYGQSRRNFYTAISRAREECIVITDQYSIRKSVAYPG